MGKTFYNGFCVVYSNGIKKWYTIQRRTFNYRPYALYIDGSQSAFFKTYIKRGALANAVKRLADDILSFDPGAKISDIYSAEIIRN